MKKIIAAAVIALLGTPATAQMTGKPFILGEGVLANVTGCDTLEQANEALAAWLNDGFAGLDRFMRTEGQRPNELNEPVCGNVAGPMVPVEVLGEFEVEHQGKMVPMWLVRFDLVAYGRPLYVFSPRPVIEPGKDA